MFCEITIDLIAGDTITCSSASVSVETNFKSVASNAISHFTLPLNFLSLTTEHLNYTVSHESIIMNAKQPIEFEIDANGNYVLKPIDLTGHDRKKKSKSKPKPRAARKLDMSAYVEELPARTSDANCGEKRKADEMSDEAEEQKAIAKCLLMLSQPQPKQLPQVKGQMSLTRFFKAA